MHDVVQVDFKNKQVIDDSADSGALVVVEPPKRKDLAAQIESTLYASGATLVGVGVVLAGAAWIGFQHDGIELFREHVGTYTITACSIISAASLLSVVRNVSTFQSMIGSALTLPVDYWRYRSYVRHMSESETVESYEEPSALAAVAPVVKPVQIASSKPVTHETGKLLQTLQKALDGAVNCIIKPPIVGASMVFLPVQPAGEIQCPQRGRIKGDFATLRGVSRDVCLALPKGTYFVNQVPDSRYPGFAVPRQQRQQVGYAELIEKIPERAAVTTMLIGQDQSGKLITTDLAEHPHTIVAGQTGSGKSIASYALLLSLLQRATPDELRVVIVDQKTTEYQPFFDGIGHLAAPIITDSAQLLPLAKQLVEAMKERQERQFAPAKVRDIAGYHSKKYPMPFIAVFIDELRDLLMELDKEDAEEATNLLTRIVQRGRSAGIHLVIMTQRPDSEAVPGKLKSQMPGRLLLKMQYTDAQTLMNQPPQDIAKLRGKGDAYLFDGNGGEYPEGERIQCAFIDDKKPVSKTELERVIAEIRKANGKPEYLFQVDSAIDDGPEPAKPDLACDDPLYTDAVMLVIESGEPHRETVKRAGVTNTKKQDAMLKSMDVDGFTGKINGKRMVLVSVPEARTKLGH